MTDLPGPGPEVTADGGIDETHARELAALVKGEVRTGRHDRMLYSTDASLYQVEPLAVVIPLTAADVVATVRYCATHGLPVLPRGGGTSLAGQCVNRAVMIDAAPHLDRVLEVDAEARTARVEPGVVLDRLNVALAPHGLMFGPDVATSAHACLGGMIGNNSAGAHSVLYGRTVENVRGIDALLADGTTVRLEEGAAERDETARDLTLRVAEIVRPLEEEIDRRYPRIVRHVDGYNLDLVLDQLRRSGPGRLDRVNLASLLCGSEGTLAVTLAAELAPVPVPRHTALTILAFDDVDAALRDLPTLLAGGPAAIELLDDIVLGLAAANVECRRHLRHLPTTARGGRGAVLYVEHFADDAAAIDRTLDDLRSRYGADRLTTHRGVAAMTAAWALRKAGEPLLHGMPGRRKPITFIEDLAVDPAVLGDFVADFRALVARHGTTAAYYAHASVGCLHIRPLVDVRDEADRRTMQAIAEEATDLVRRYGGALSGEHGDGRLRSPLLERYFGSQICEAMRRIKSIFDPRGLLNPGNLVDPEPMSTHLRVLPDTRPVRVPEVETYFRYGPEHGFDEAVHLCNGAGVCRKRRGGTMCPSYRATLDERHATRGRGNALRLAITGQLGDGTPAWNDPETLETLDLCLSCKACKAECPSNVDIARMKAEYLAQSYRVAGGPPWRARILGEIRTLSRLGSALAPIANTLARLGPSRSIAGRTLGLDPRRSLPPSARSLYRDRVAGVDAKDAPSVVLLPDCFTVYGEPAVGRAARDVLERLGYRVLLPRLGCCGRAMISTGLLERAVVTCSRTARALLEVVERERPVAIVGCEPSCVSAIADDWTDLELDVERTAIDRLAALAEPVEHFVERRWGDHPRTPDLATPRDTPPVLLHGHCHEKALWGVEPSAGLVRRLVGDRLVVPDSGCCGMAGAFGYTRGHYELSMQIGELALFPAVRAAGPEAVILASGTSCRHQLRDALDREAMHPIEYVRAEGLRD